MFTKIRCRWIKYWRFILCGEKISYQYLYEQEKNRIFNTADFIEVHDANQLSIGERSNIGRCAWIWCHDNEDTGACESGGRGALVIGERVAIGHRFHADCYEKVEIGNDCLLADDILILTSNHGTNPELDGSYVKQPFTVNNVTIEEGCWIGSRVTILPRVKLGKKSIIGANSVVSKDIPPYSMAVGIPAKVIKKWDFESHEWIRIKNSGE